MQEPLWLALATSKSDILPAFGKGCMKFKHGYN